MSRTPRVLCVRIGCIPSFCIAKVFIISVTTTISHVGWFCDCNTMFSDCSSCLIQLCIEDVGGVSSNKDLHFVLRVKALLATCLWPMPVLGIKIHGLAMRGLRLWNLACSRGGKPTIFTIVWCPRWAMTAKSQHDNMSGRRLWMVSSWGRQC